MEQVKDIIEEVSNTLTDIAQSDVVVGSPVVVGEVTVVPISRVAAGFGGGGGSGEGQEAQRSQSGKGMGGGSGGGAVVRPVAVAVFGPEGVEILPIADRQGKLAKFLDQLPDLIERFKKSAEDK